MHRGYRLNVGVNNSHIPAEIDVFFAKGITLLYAIKDASSLFDLLAQAKLSVFDYSISTGARKEKTIGTGKGVCYLSKSDFFEGLQKLEASGKHLWVRGNVEYKDDGLFYFEGLCTDDISIKQFVNMQQKVVSALSSSYPNLYQQLVHDKSDIYWQWQRLDSNAVNNL